MQLEMVRQKGHTGVNTGSRMNRTMLSLVRLVLVFGTYGSAGPVLANVANMILGTLRCFFTTDISLGLVKGGC